MATNTIRAKNSGTAYQPVPGDITVNGGYTVSYGAEHGNALGGACGSGNNVGHGGSSTPHEIVINGGTLIPKSTAATGTYDVGATGANVIVTGGSFPLQKNSTGSVDGLSIKGAGVYSADGSSLTMVKIDVSAMEGIKVGYKINSFDVLVDNKPLDVPYGLADRVDSEKTLYFWLPSSAKGKSVTIENVTLRDDEGNIIKAGYPFSLPEVGGKDDVTKRWVIFKVDTEQFSDELNKLLYKRYDGLGWDYSILSKEIVAQNIEIPELPGAFITKEEELAYTAVRTTDWSGKPTTDASSSGQISTTGTYRITVNYNEFINDPKVSNSFWGHQTTLESIISPADSRITNLKGTSDYQEGTTEDGKKKYKTLTLTADVLPSEKEAKTCAAPDGTVQFYVNGVKVGKPVALTPAADSAKTADGYNYSTATMVLDFVNNPQKYPIPALADETFEIKAQYLGGTNYTLSSEISEVYPAEPENFPFAAPPTPTTGDDGKPDVNVDTTGNGKPDINIDIDNDGKADINLDTTGDGKADSNIDTDGDGKPDKNLIGGVVDEQPKPEPPAEKPAEEPEKPPVKDFPLTSDCGETALELSSLMAMLLAGAVVLAKKKHD